MSRHESIVARQLDMSSVTATRRPANTNEGTNRSGGEPDSRLRLAVLAHLGRRFGR